MRNNKTLLPINSGASNREESPIREHLEKRQHLRLFLARDDSVKLSVKEIDCCIRATD